MNFTTRFAPSPTGPLHLGHAYSALLAYDMTQAERGNFLLRIEDIDQTRCKPNWEQKIYDDLHWLGLQWPTPVLRQSDRLSAYKSALDTLWERGLLYPCTCTRRDISAAATAPQEGVAPPLGPDGLIYSGTCRNNHDRTGPLPKNTALRLDMQAAAHSLKRSEINLRHELISKRPRSQQVPRISSKPRDSGFYQNVLSFTETGSGPDGQTGQFSISSNKLALNIGDIVLSRRDFRGSYHLSVVLDDATQGITDVIRGQDLFEATTIHVLLQNLLGLPTPNYHHHSLIRDSTGKRLAKRDNALSIAKYRGGGATPTSIRARVGLA